MTHGDLWHASIAGEAEVAKGLFAVAELGLASTADKTTAELSAQTLVGVSYEINNFLDINAGIKLGLTKPDDDVSLPYGLALKFKLRLANKSRFDAGFRRSETR